MPNHISSPISFSTFDFSSLGIPMPFAGDSELGVNVTVLAVSNTSISSILSVDTSNYNLSLGPFLVACENREVAQIIAQGM